MISGFFFPKPMMRLQISVFCRKIKYFKKLVDIIRRSTYNYSCIWDWSPGCGSAWLERLVWDQEVAGSNPVTPINATRS